MLDVVQQAVVVLVDDGVVLGGDFAFGRDGVEIQVVRPSDGSSAALPLIGERDPQALVEEGHLLEAGAQRLEIEVGRLRRCRHPGRTSGWCRFRSVSSPLTRLALRLAAVGEGHPPDVALAADLGVDAAGQCVDHGDADAVQAAGNGVAAAAELAAGVQDGHDDLDGGLALRRVHVHGDAAAVVRPPGPRRRPAESISMWVAVTGQGLVHRVVHHFVDQVVQAARPGGTDVHAGAFPDGFEALEHGDVAGAVAVRSCGLRRACPPLQSPLLVPLPGSLHCR